ncbi:MAG: cytochrome c-type biogenesis protein [Pontibacterium sp.]
MRSLACLLLLLVSFQTSAAISAYEFDDEETRKRFHVLTEELRCPKCQNQNLADSNSPIAKDLRNEVYRMLDAGENDGEIVDFMVARYGEFVLYRPRVSVDTYLLWYGPFVLLFIGVIVVLLMTRRKKRPVDEVSSKTLNDTERQQLSSLLKQDSEK